MELNRQRVVFSRQEAETLPPNRPYVAYICYYDWTEGEHATLMHSHEDLAEVLLILKGSEMIIDHVSRMSIVYLDSHPHWMFIESLCAPIGPKSIMAAVLICYILYLLLSVLIQHMMSKRRIVQLYSE